MEALIQRLYARLGTRYLIAFQVWMLVVAVLTAAMTLAAGVPYLQIPLGQMLKVAPIWGGTIVIAFVIIGTQLRRRFGDAIAWIRGNRTTANAQAVWENLASEVYKLAVFGIATFSLLSITPLLFGGRILGVPWYGVVAFGLAIEFTILIAALLDYLGAEVLARPVLREVALYLPATFEPEHPSPSLRWRLGVGMTITSLYGVLLGSAIASGTESPVLKLLLGLSFALFMSGTLVLFIATLLGTAVLSPMNDIVRAMRSVGRGDLGGRVAILGADEVGFLARGFNSMVSGLAEREVLRSAMGAYIDPHVTERILLEGAELEGEEVDVSVIFVDIRDFTESADGQAPKDTVRMLNDFFELIVPIVVAHGGQANKFLGDGLLAVFGAPERFVDHANRAVAASWEIARAIAERYAGTIRVGIGINSGPVVVGSVGGGGRWEFTLIGDSVNVAKRVEQATKELGDTVLLSEETRSRLSTDEYLLHFRSAVPMRGKTQVVALYALSLDDPRSSLIS
jgi:adenylate cyclase